MNDAALVDALLARVPGAGSTFIAYHHPFVRKSVLCASPVAAGLVDDLTHDVYVYIWREDFRVLRQWRRQHPLQAFLRVVVTRLVWDRLSRVQPAWEQVDADPHSVAGADAATCDASPTPEEQVAANELFRMGA